MSRAVLEPGVAPQTLIDPGYGAAANGQLPVRRIYLLNFALWQTPDRRTPAGTPPVMPNPEATGWIRWMAQVGTPDAKRSYQADIGLTFNGLEQLGLAPALLDVLRQQAPAFCQGALVRAGRLLGDTGLCAPHLWHAPYQGDQLHALVYVHVAPAEQDQGFADFERDFVQAVASFLGPNQSADYAQGLSLYETSSVVPHPAGVDPRVGMALHFGLVDDFSLPRFVGPSDSSGPDTYGVGDVLLGHHRSDGSNVWRTPAALRQRSTADIQPQHTPTRYEPARFFHDGSFGVHRKMEQNRPAFDRLVAELVSQWEGGLQQGKAGLHDYVRQWVVAKWVGRWNDGRLVQPNETLSLAGFKAWQQQSTEAALPHATGYQPHDAKGLGCPFGSHVRRTNPRDDPAVPFVKRPLLRRGRPYTYEATAGTHPLHQGVGLMGLFFCASIEEQFEAVMGAWVNQMPMARVGAMGHTSKDPLIGNHHPLDAPFEIPVAEGPSLRVHFTEPLVLTRGTAYAFFPGLAALQQWAAGDFHHSTPVA